MKSPYSKSITVSKTLLKCKSVKWNFVYDEKNFLYCVVRHLWPLQTGQIAHFKNIPARYLDQFNLEGLKFPLQYRQINKFVQKKNKHLKLNIRVLFDDEDEVSVMDTFSNRTNDKNKTKNILNLLMLKYDRSYKGADPDGIKTESFSTLRQLEHEYHFFTIKNMNAYLNMRKFNCSPKKKRVNNYYCETCLLRFRSKTKKDSHRQYCQNDKQTIVYPNEGDTINYRNQKNSFKAPVIGFADFECFMEKNEQEQVKKCKKCDKNPISCQCDISASVEQCKHKACAYSVCFVDLENDVFYQETYSGEDAVERFLEKLEDYERLVEERKQRFKHVNQVVASPKEWLAYHRAETCHICEKPFDNQSLRYRKVVDHDHVSGKIIQAAHSICNLQRQGPYLTPLYFHNAQG